MLSSVQSLGNLHAIVPEWSAHERVVAMTTTRTGGISLPPYSENNLALHVGDDPEHVNANRKMLSKLLGGNVELQWLEQVHSAKVHHVEEASGSVIGDGLCTFSPLFEEAVE